MADVLVELVQYDTPTESSSSRATIAEARTDALGGWQFADVPAGTYDVQINAPDGFGFIAADQGDDAVDSDVIGGGSPGSRFGRFRLDLDGTDGVMVIDAGLDIEVRGMVFIDSFGSGFGEPDDGIAFQLQSNYVVHDEVGVMVEPGPEASTGTGGTYVLSGLRPGPLQIKVISGDDYAPTRQVVLEGNIGSDISQFDDSASVLLVAGQGGPVVNAGMAPSAVVSGFIWSDTNGDGIRGADEHGIEGITVVASSASTFYGDVATTGPDGMYVINDVPPVDDLVVRVAEAWWDLSPEDAVRSYTLRDVGTDESVDSDVAPDGTLGPLSLVPNHRVNVDAGVVVAPVVAPVAVPIEPELEILPVNGVPQGLLWWGGLFVVAGAGLVQRSRVAPRA